MSSSYPSVIPCSRLYSDGRGEITLLNYSEELSIIIRALQLPHTCWYSQLSHCDHTLALAFLLAQCSNSNLHLCALNLSHILSSSKSSPRTLSIRIGIKGHAHTSPFGLIYIKWKLAKSIAGGVLILLILIRP